MIAKSWRNKMISILVVEDEDEDEIEGFNLGCDDYICKPFNMKELVLRVKAVLKRTNSIKKENNFNHFVNFSDALTININTREVKA
jgi:DNA-binding response OmpR family regulator